MAPTANELLANVQSDITAANTVIDGAMIFVQGVPGMIDAAVQAVIANGVTPEQLQPVSDLSDVLEQKAGALKTAMESGTTPPSTSGRSR